MGNAVCAPHPPRFRTCIASNALCQHALTFSHKGLTGVVDFGVADDLHSVKAEAATVRAAAARAATSCPWSKDGSASTSQDETRSRVGFAPAPPGTRFSAWASSARLTVASVSRVATDKTSQCRSTLAGSVRRVFCHCQPTLFSALKPVSIQKRISRHDAPASAGSMSVRMVHGSS